MSWTPHSVPSLVMLPKQLHIFLVRHGEALHNVASRARPRGISREAIFNDPQYHDAELTPKGIAEATTTSMILEKNISTLLEKGLEKKDLILVSSPLVRAITTARHLCPKENHLTVLESIREFSGQHWCDSRRTRKEIEHIVFKENGFRTADIQLFSDKDPMPASHPRETKQQLKLRIWNFLGWLSQVGKRSERMACVIAISHSAYLRHLLAVIGLCNPADRAFSNLEVRHLEVNPIALEEYVLRESSVVKCCSVKQKLGVSSFCIYPHVTPEFPLNSLMLTKHPTLKFHQVSILNMESLLPVIQPFSLLCFPPLASASMFEENKKASTALEEFLEIAARSTTLFSTTRFVEEVVLNNSNRNRWLRNRLIEDARHVLKALNDDDKWEAICKESVHDQNCVVFLLPSCSKMNEDTLRWDLRVIEEVLLNAKLSLLASMEPKINSRLQTVLKELRGSSSAWPFLAPVDWKGMGLTDYPKVVKEPMDLKTVGKKFKLKGYKDPSQFWKDVELIWSNCKLFNSETAEVYHLAVEMETLSTALRTSFEIDYPPEGATIKDSSSSLEGPTAPEAVNQLVERFGRLEPLDAAVVIRYVAQEAPSCLSPLLAKQEGGGREFEFDVGTLYSEYPVIFKRTHGLVKLLLHGHKGRH